MLRFSLIFLLFLAACQPQMKDVKESRFLLGTLVEFTIYTSNEDRAIKAIHLATKEMQRVEDTFTTFGPGSNSVKKFNQASANTWVQLDEEVEKLLSRAVDISKETGGAFDPTLGRLNQLWAFSGNTLPSMPPTLEAIQQALQQSGINKVKQSQRGWVKKESGLMLDFGAIAKGYAIDRGVWVLKQHGIQHAIINAGGDMRILGDHGEKPWRIAIRHPRQGDPLGWVEVTEDTSIVTSGDYERFYIHKHKRYHHILDPDTGLPSDASQSVTVIAPSAMLADAWSTGLFVLGERKGSTYLKKIRDIEALWVTKNGEHVQTLGFRLQQ